MTWMWNGRSWNARIIALCWAHHSWRTTTLHPFNPCKSMAVPCEERQSKSGFKMCQYLCLRSIFNHASIEYNYYYKPRLCSAHQHSCTHRLYTLLFLCSLPDCASIFREPFQLFLTFTCIHLRFYPKRLTRKLYKKCIDHKHFLCHIPVQTIFTLLFRI